MTIEDFVVMYIITQIKQRLLACLNISLHITQTFSNIHIHYLLHYIVLKVQ